jgi:hypothetical protein
MKQELKNINDMPQMGERINTMGCALLVVRATTSTIG